MFKKLKDKIAEEVKSSPSRIQQFAQAAQAAVSSSSSSTPSDTISGSDNFFSITEEDTPQNTPKHNTNNDLQLSTSLNSLNTMPLDNGNTTTSVVHPISAYRTRKLSNSSMASDVSFRLPAYDQPAAYHLQSDMESASEFEDGASMSSMKNNTNLDVISKEQLHQAYRSALERYQKYRNRYTEVARRYRDLERDNNKARSVLVETQDKALRRISELREQCTLEQQAKAHLESALRLEMEEMQCVIKTLTTKLSLHGADISTNDEQQPQLLNGKENLIELDNTDAASSKSDTISLINLNVDSAENGNATDDSKIKQLEDMLNEYKKRVNEEKSKLIVKNEEIKMITQKFEESQTKIRELTTREEENTILLAENKMMIHSELENKEKEMKNLQQRLTALEKSAKQSVTERDQLQKTLRQEKYRINELVDGKKGLDAKISELEKANTALEQSKKELQAKIIIIDSEKETLSMKTNQELEKFKKEYETMLRKNEELEKLSNIKSKENHEKLEVELKHIKSAHAEISRQSNELQTANKSLENELAELKLKLDESVEKSKSISDELSQVAGDKQTLEQRLKQMFEEKQQLSAEHDKLKLEKADSQSEYESQLQSELVQRSTQIETLNLSLNEMGSEKQDLQATISQLQSELSQKSTQIESLTQSHNEKSDSQADVNSLKEKIDSLKSEKRDLEKTLEKEIREKSELKIQVTNILQEIGRLEEQLTEVRQSYAEIEREKRALEEKTVELAKSNSENPPVKKPEKEHKEELKQRIRDIQCENSQLSEKNCFLEESNGRLEMTLKEVELSLVQELEKQQELENSLSAVRLEYESGVEKLQEKLRQCLDENSRLFNAKELMDHEYRSLQDKCETIDKEKLCVLDTNKCMQDELIRLRLQSEAVQALEREKNNLAATCDRMHVDLESLQNENEHLKMSRDTLQVKLDKLNEEIPTINEQNNLLKEELTQTQASNAQISKSLSDKSESLQKEIIELDNRNQMNLAELKETADEKNALKEKLKTSAEQLKKLENFDQLTIENEYLNTSVKHLQATIDKNVEENVRLQQECKDVASKLKSQQCELYVLEEEKAKRLVMTHEKDTEIGQLKDNCKRTIAQNNEMQTELKQLNDQLNTTKLLNEELQAAKDVTENQLQSLNNKISHLEQLNETFQNELRKQKLLNDEQHQITETLRKNFADLQTDLSLANDINKKQLEKCSALTSEIESSRAIINDLNKDLNSEQEKFEHLQQYEQENQKLQEKIAALEQQSIEVSKLHKTDEVDSLRRANESLKLDLAELKRSTDGKISNLNNEIDELLENAKAYKTKSVELESIRISNTNLQKEIHEYKENASVTSDYDLEEVLAIKRDRDEMDEKLKKIMHEVQDVSNRNLFLEQKCENYLILEQSNERLKLQNDKLSRQLDDTLVSMQHNEGITANTEFEYLKNIMFQYLTNNISSNGSTLVKVIAAVLKFSPQQTQVVVEREHQRSQTLVNQINSLLP